MKPSDFDETQRATLGSASCFVGIVMFLLQLGIIGAVVFGVKDRQGIDYAFKWPLWVYLGGIPLGVILAVAGFTVPKANRSASEYGLLLMLAGPLLFLVFAIVVACHR